MHAVVVRCVKTLQPFRGAGQPQLLKRGVQIRGQLQVAKPSTPQIATIGFLAVIVAWRLLILVAIFAKIQGENEIWWQYKKSGFGEI